MEKSRRDKGGNTGLLFAIGLAVGAAAGYYFNTEEGRRMRRQAGTQINQLGRDVSSRARQGLDSISSGINTAVDRGRHYVNEVGSTIKSRLGGNQSEEYMAIGEETTRESGTGNRGGKRTTSTGNQNPMQNRHENDLG